MSGSGRRTPAFVGRSLTVPRRRPSPKASKWLKTFRLALGRPLNSPVIALTYTPILVMLGLVGRVGTARCRLPVKKVPTKAGVRSPASLGPDSIIRTTDTLLKTRVGSRD
ncbi:hypothetical protein K523DRAFT_9538 [Schizophyllum commune Tattone D]|nr:hypothetical protein K523DRAFT_9538 [Schizophyllum commune Tattone D]